EVCEGQGSANQVAPINTAGHTPVLLTDLTPADLAGIDVLFLDNCENTVYGQEFLDHVSDIEAAVAGGLVLMFHDRFVDPAESVLPGGASFDIQREVDTNGQREME